MAGLPHHADLFAATARKNKNDQRVARGRLMDLMRRRITAPGEFRSGTLADIAPVLPPGGGPNSAPQ
jgi:hypothetical protein